MPNTKDARLRLTGLEHATLVTEPLVLLAPADHPLAGQRSVTWDDLRERTFIDFEASWAIRMITDELFADRKTPRRVAFAVSDVHTLIDMLNRGLGIAVVPQSISRKSIAAALSTVHIADQPGRTVDRVRLVPSRRRGHLARDRAAAASSIPGRSPRHRVEGDQRVSSAMIRTPAAIRSSSALPKPIASVGAEGARARSRSARAGRAIAGRLLHDAVLVRAGRAARSNPWKPASMPVSRRSGAASASAAISALRRRWYTSAYPARGDRGADCPGAGRRRAGRARTTAVGRLLPGHAAATRARAQRSTQADRRRMRLADRAEQEDAVRCDPLQRPHRLPVVAELGVVVVLDDPPAVWSRPGDELRVAGRGEHRAGRCLVGRGHDRRLGARRRERGDIQPFSVHGDAEHLHAECTARCRPPTGPRVLDGEGADAALGERTQHERHALGEARPEHDVRGSGLGRAGSAERRGNRLARERMPGGVPVAELGTGHLTSGTGERPRPVVGRE